MQGIISRGWRNWGHSQGSHVNSCRKLRREMEIEKSYEKITPMGLNYWIESYVLGPLELENINFIFLYHIPTQPLCCTKVTCCVPPLVVFSKKTKPTIINMFYWLLLTESTTWLVPSLPFVENLKGEIVFIFSYIIEKRREVKQNNEDDERIHCKIN